MRVWNLGLGNAFYTGPLTDMAATVLDDTLPVGNDKVYLSLDKIANGQRIFGALLGTDVCDFDVIQFSGLFDYSYFTYFADMRMVDTGNTSDTYDRGALFRSDGTMYNGYEFQMSNDGYVRLYVRVNSSSGTSLDSAVSPNMVQAWATGTPSPSTPGAPTSTFPSTACWISPSWTRHGPPARWLSGDRAPAPTTTTMSTTTWAWISDRNRRNPAQAGSVKDAAPRERGAAFFYSHRTLSGRGESPLGNWIRPWRNRSYNPPYPPNKNEVMFFFSEIP